MATPTLIATAGAADANSYVTVAEANAYHDSRLHNDPWINASTADKTKTLIWATRVLDRLNFKGRKTNDVPYQALRWPRYGVLDSDDYVIDSEVIPPQIKHATSELAMLLINSDTTALAGTEGFEEIKVGPISLKIRPNDRVKAIVDEINSLLHGLIVNGLEVTRG